MRAVEGVSFKGGELPSESDDEKGLKFAEEDINELAFEDEVTGWVE